MVLVAGLLLLVGVPAVWWLTRPTPAGQTVTSVNAAAALSLAGTPPAAPGGTGPVESRDRQTQEPVGSSSGATTPAPVTSSEPAPTSAAPTSAALAPTDSEPDSSQPATAQPDPGPLPGIPLRVVIPDLGVDTSVVPVGVQDDGELEIPRDVDTVGWYRFGALPGAPGSAVLTGHVDSADQGPGAFARLGDLDPGEQFSVVDEAGVQRWFAVVAREQWPKGEVPLDRLFDPNGQPRIVLLTCGGAFDEAVRGYRDNIAVTATPVG